MLTTRKQITLNGESTILIGEKSTTIATMFASLNENGKLNTNSTIIDSANYMVHSEEVDADIAEFNAEATKLIKEA